MPVPDRLIEPAALAEFDAHGTRITTMPLSFDGRTVVVYLAAAPEARGILLALGGNGNDAASMLRVVGPRARAAGLTLATFSYYTTGEASPTVAQVRDIAFGVALALRNSQTTGAPHLYLLGHSLGCWFTADVASRLRPAPDGLILAAPGTDVAGTFGPQYFPLDLVLRYRSDADLAVLDARAAAATVTAPTIVFTSADDDAIPPALSRQVYDALPVATRKSLMRLEDVSHGGYLSQSAVWTAIDGFFALPERRPGYSTTSSP